MKRHSTPRDWEQEAILAQREAPEHINTQGTMANIVNRLRAAKIQIASLEESFNACIDESLVSVK